jgi:DNA invertase Pin-like site-specific DNA recombinase
MQLATMRDYVRKRGWQVGIEIKDIGSGATKRPEREELLQAVRRPEVDLVVVWRLDPLGAVSSRPCDPPYRS